ncbi:unnamed protein product [Acanthoscelides obtectus]|uniref:Alpha-carbonic anhydrase domain-containing protein n=1 Tax=Acanthoscelides obtectus TaxID=200917 RepID=A0A9P0LWP3_ACAOB|nr:unnamed protein product [Acanthoscelides obtectus]CAK1649741.1 hypothetical protein AOBTE_LOCUS16395 [Acanthoscelides obtectus]
MFPLEGHFVHLPENPDSGDTSVVLSVFYEVSKCANPTFDIICDGVDQVSKEVECPVESKKAIALQGLLPKRISSYFTYENSDGEEIIFIIMATPAKISKRQLVGITSICDENGVQYLQRKIS